MTIVLIVLFPITTKITALSSSVNYFSWHIFLSEPFFLTIPYALLCLIVIKIMHNNYKHTLEVQISTNFPFIGVCLVQFLK